MRGEDELVEADPEGGLRPPDEVPEVEAPDVVTSSCRLILFSVFI